MPDNKTERESGKTFEELASAGVPTLPWEIAGGADTDAAEPDDMEPEPAVEDRVVEALQPADERTESESMAEVGQESLREDDSAEVEQTDPEEPPAGEDDDTEDFVFELDGEQISREEAWKGFMRNRSFTQKSQALADRRRAIEQQGAEYSAAMAAIARADPAKASEAAAEVQRVQTELQQLHQETFQTQQRTAVLDFIESRSIPQDKVMSEFGAMEKAARSYGFTAQELESVADARLLDLLHDAVRFSPDALAETRRKVVTTDPQRVHRPSAKSRRPQSKRRGDAKAARAALKQTGDPRAAAAVLASWEADD